VIRQDRPKR
jgi:hypothetical protein